ncbi:RNase H-domain-containing protein [Kalaharituber pfeilii]|nr:RNase H-domain-containing protein [Kalaharituber pfeilii]
MVGDDIKSAFNFLKREKVVPRIWVNANLAAFVGAFLQPNKFNLSWDGKERATGRMTDGTPQGSLLSPVLFLTATTSSQAHREAPAAEAASEGYELDPSKSETLIIGTKGPTYQLTRLHVDWELQFDGHHRRRLHLGKGTWPVANRLTKLAPAKRRQLYTSTARNIAMWSCWEWEDYAGGSKRDSKVRDLEKWQYTDAHELSTLPPDSEKEEWKRAITEAEDEGWANMFFEGDQDYHTPRHMSNDKRCRTDSHGTSARDMRRRGLAISGLQDSNRETEKNHRWKTHTRWSIPDGEKGLGSPSCKRGDLDIAVMWVKGHKGIEGNEEADKAAKTSVFLQYQDETGRHRGRHATIRQSPKSRGEGQAGCELQTTTETRPQGSDTGRHIGRQRTTILEIRHQDSPWEEYAKGSPASNKLRELKRGLKAWQYIVAQRIAGSPWGTRRDIVEGLANLESVQTFAEAERRRVEARILRPPLLLAILPTLPMDADMANFEKAIVDAEDEGWTAHYTDGSRINDTTGAGAFSRGCMPISRYLGEQTTVNDAELLVMHKVFSQQDGELLIITDSKIVISKQQKIAQGEPTIGSAAQLVRDAWVARNHRSDLDTAIMWVKGHKGIQGNELAD